MKKVTVFALVVFLFLTSQAANNFQGLEQKVYWEKSPYSSAASILPTDATWDLQISFDLQIASGALGNAGAEFDGNFYYTTRWASNLLHKYNMNGILVEEFSIPGVSGLRDLAFDGTYMYGGANAMTIYVMDFSTKTLIGTIPSPIAVRNIAYDPVYDALWVGNWDTPLTLVSKTGATLATIPNPGLSGMYGTAYDSWSDGGPYLWIFDQGMDQGAPQYIHQLNLATGLLTGVSHDVTLEFPAVLGIAGGLFTAVNIVPGKASIGGVLQGTPDMFFVYELAVAADPTDPNPPTNVTAYSDYTTPSQMALNWSDPTTLVNGTPINPTDFTIEIQRNGSFLISIPGGIGNYTDNGLIDGVLYEYTLHTELIANDSTSVPVTVSWYAGGSPFPAAPTNLLAVGSTTNAVLTWDDPTTQEDGTPLDDLDSIYVYREGIKIAAVNAGVETYTDTPPPGFFYNYTVVAKDNETPPHLSQPSNVSGTFVGASPNFLVWVGPNAMGASAISGDSIFNALVANGESAFLTNNLFEFGNDLSIFEGIFVVLGIFPNNHVIQASDSEGIALENYLQNGGRIFLEGGDCYNYDPTVGGYNILPWFGLNPGLDGSGDVYGVIGLNDLSAFQFAYNGDNNWMDQLTPATSTPVWQNNANPNICGVFNTSYGMGRAIGIVPSFGGFVSSAEALNLIPRTANKFHSFTKNDQSIFKTRTSREAQSVFVKKAGFHPELKKDRAQIEKLLKVTPGGIFIEANTQNDLMAAYVALFRLQPTPPAISLSSLAFSDTLLIGATLNNILIVRNSGGALAEVLNFTITENPAVSWLNVTPTSGSLPANQAAAITLALDAGGLTAGTYNTTLDVSSNDPNNPLLQVSVTLVANEAPLVSVSPDSFHFDLLSGEKDSVQFTISNLGAGPLTFELTDEDLNVPDQTRVVDRSYLIPEFNVTIPKDAIDWRVGTPQTEGAGGPDLFGYKWIDSDEPGGPIFNWIDISATGTAVVGLGDDDFQGPFPIGFTLSYYGNDYTEFYICSNGFLGFGPTAGYNFLSNVQIPTADDPNNILPWMWDDLNPSSGGFIYYQTVGNQLIVQFVDLPEYGAPGTVTAEVILNSNGSILYQYLAFQNGIDISSCTVGIENENGTDGLQVIFNDPSYLHDNLAIKFAKESAWLSENPDSGYILPGGSMNIWAIVNTADMLGGNYLATVVVNSNDPLNPEVKLPKVSLHVTGVPRVLVTPNPLVFDSTFVGLTPHLDLTVANIGTDQLIVSNITSSHPVFTIDTTSLSLPPFSQHQVRVTFAPLLPGSYSGIIVFETNDPGLPSDTVVVSGVGLEAPVAIINTFFQNPVYVAMGDSTNIFINVGNAGGSPLVWSARASSVSASEQKIKLSSFGPFESSEFFDITPTLKLPNMMHMEATWDLQLSFNLEIASGAPGNAGAEFDGTYFYTTRWASNLLHRYDMTGNLVEEFTIPGVSELRDLAFDGTYMYGGANANTIYVMDFTTKTLVGSIPSPVAVRNIAYDPVYDALWVGNWDTPLTLVSKTGTTLATLPNPGLVGMYGTAYDSWTDGGPYLWIFDQGFGAGSPQFIHQLNIASGTLTGVSYDVAQDFPASVGIAGGLFTTETFIGGVASIGGVLQGTPDMFFVYELTETAPDWIKVLVTGGSIAPMDQFDIPVRIYQNNTPGDTAYVIINTNDPALPVTSILVIRTMVTGLGDLNALPTTYEVSQNYPNPFNPSTTIKYQLPEISNVKLVIYNVLGQKVRTLLSDRIEAGYHSVVWDGRNDEGRAVASGIYIYKFEAGNFNRTMKLMMLK